MIRPEPTPEGLRRLMDRLADMEPFDRLAGQWLAAADRLDGPEAGVLRQCAQDLLDVLAGEGPEVKG